MADGVHSPLCNTCSYRWTHFITSNTELMLGSTTLTDLFALHLRTTGKKAYLALLPDEYGKFVHVWDSEHLGHKVVAEVSRCHLHHIPCFPQLIDRLQQTGRDERQQKFHPPQVSSYRRGIKMRGL